MRLFVFEHLTGGGMAGVALPPSLVREADLMVRSVLQDLAGLPVELLTSRDPRLPPIAGVSALTPERGESPLQLYTRGLSACDTAWPTAPETGGLLERLARATLENDRHLVGCRPEAIALTASKARTARALTALGIPCVPTFTGSGTLPPLAGPWVVKPDDGAGAEDTRVVADWRAARDRLIVAPERFVAQPWLAGEPLSLSLIAGPAVVELLAVNRQRVVVADGAVRLEAIDVNAVPDLDGRFAALAERLVRGIPGLSGYVGVDLLDTGNGPMVLEINPRLTTSCSGLRAATGINVAARVLGLDPRADGAPPPRPRGRSVTLSLETAHGE